MNKLTLQFGALTIAAALTFIFTSCSSSSDDPMAQQPIEEPTNPVPQTIQITVGAGIENGASTRSEVETTGEGTNTKRTLKFSDGDKLYVTGTVAKGMILAGILDATSINGTSATFTGTYTSTNGNEFSKDPGLHVYQYSGGKYVTVSHTFGTTDPLGECTYVSALLVHNGTIGNLEVYPELSYAQLMPIYNHFLVTTTTSENLIEKLMTKCLYVSGSYSDSKFSLKVAESGYCSPIFNCNISGLAASTPYQVEHIFGTENWTTSVGEVTTDDSGNATFAYYISNMKDNTSYSHAIRFKPTSGASSSTWYKIDFGDKTFTNKVYNVTRALTQKDIDSNTTPGRPTFTDISPIPSPNAKGGYIFNKDAADTDFTLSGTSTGYYFRFRKTANITLNNFTATYNALNSGLWGFFDCDDNLTLHLTGSNSITCKNKDQCIYVFGNMTLTGTSGATLTVTCKSDSSTGILVEGTKTLTGVSVSGPTKNGDGTYSWTYTVN
ncbi:MAG: hypothetical protein IJ886_06475 [Prevotella sp.]|nr:hypothetical protein [Prevotella sp.]MBR2229898.1 hypothetical protein [Prevotella sp.]MBR3111617.1 hypothetical protein [Prevotella sp.]